MSRPSIEDKNRNEWACLILRLGVGGVFFLFGFDKLPHPEKWIIYYPEFLPKEFLNPYIVLKLQGVFELGMGLALILGFLTRTAAFGAAATLFVIVLTLGWDPVAVRDGGLLFASVAIGIVGPGKWSLDAILERIAS